MSTANYAYSEKTNLFTCVFLCSLDNVTSSWQGCVFVIVCIVASDMVSCSRQARLHMACGALTYNSPSCLSAVVWPTFIKTNTDICFVLPLRENGINKCQGGTAGAVGGFFV